MDVADLPGSGDCEAHIAVWGQPALFASSTAYLVAALIVLSWSRRHNSDLAPIARWQVWLYAVGLGATGLGSMDYHGPALGPEPLLHDGGLTIALVAALSIDLAQLRLWCSWGLPVVTIPAVVVFPGLVAVASVGLVVAEIVVYRRGLRTPRPALYAGVACLAVGGVIFALSRTGGPLCDPRSLLQGHALWHVLTAAALTLWAVAALPDRQETP